LEGFVTESLCLFSCKSKNSSGLVINAGHFIVKSDLAPPDALAQVKRHSISELESDIELQKLIYDRFTVQLKQAKVLVGDSIEKSLQQAYDSHPDLEFLNLVDDIDIHLSVELCVMQRSSSFPRCRVNGNVPLFKVNFSDAKYKTLMQIPLMLKESGLINDSPESAQDTKVERKKIDRRWFNTMDTPIWKQDSGALLLESDSESSENEKDETESNSDDKSEERAIQLDFRVEQFLACILESDGEKESLLCQVDLQKLQVNMDKQLSEMKLKASLHSLDVKDFMQDGHQFNYLVTSNKKILQQKNDDGKGLVDIEFIQCDPTNPNYDAKYKGMDQTIHVTLSTFTFIVTRSSILKLQNFATRTFANNTNEEEANKVSKKDTTSQKSKKANSSNMCARVLLDSVNVILNSEGKKLATAELSLGDLSVIMTEGQINLATKFANLAFTDNLCPTPESGKLLSIQGDQLIDLRYNSFINDGRSEYPGYDHGVYLRMGSAQINVLEPSIKRLQVYGEQFSEMQATYSKASKAAKQAAQDSAKQVSQVADKLHFDILVSTPIITLPDTEERDKIVAHLGELYASNTFQEDTNEIKAGLHAIKLESQFCHADNTSHTLSILDQVDIDFVVKMTAEGSTQPDLDVDGQIQDINVRLTDKQYAFLIQFANRLSNSPPGDGHEAKKSTSQKQATKQIKEKDPNARAIQFGLNVKSIGLELFKDTSSTEDSIAPPSLTRIEIRNIITNISQFNNGTMEGNFIISSFSMDDTRPMIPTKFKHVISTIEDGDQLVVSMEKTKLIAVTLKNPKIILSLEHLLLIRDFFVLPTTNEESSMVQSSEPMEADLQVEEKSAGDMSFMIKVLHPEVILLAQSNSEDTEALIVSIDEVMLAKQAQTSIVVTQFGLYLCNMSNRKETTLQCLQNFDFNFSMSSERLGLSLDPLILQLSYGDVMLISDIVNKALALSSTDGTQNKTSSQDLEKKSSTDLQRKTTPQEVRYMFKTYTRKIFTISLFFSI
jgi:vacuolar protein sorting-associated protein 13A/C